MTQHTAQVGTSDILDHHLQSFGAGDLKAVLADYTDESIIITPDAVYRGPQEATRFFETLFADFAKPGASFAMKQRTVEGETAFIAWSAETADNIYHLGTDTFWIHDGKILVQTFAGHVTPKR